MFLIVIASMIAHAVYSVPDPAQMLQGKLASNIMSSRIVIPQYSAGHVVNSSAVSNLGNKVTGKNLTDLSGLEFGQYGIGISQIALGNQIDSDQGSQHIGNEITLDDIVNTTIVSSQDSHENLLISSGNGNGTSSTAGNIVEVGDLVESDILVSQTSLYNQVTSGAGMAVSGNTATVGDISAGSTIIAQTSQGNVANTDHGEGIVGNQLSLGNIIGGRKLLKYNDGSL
eukprot:TRINITY_DN1225_c2_g1_i2.p1 TRINITY_DN1225_c2_g1~~TRINITY_DN1225_c2_g1_i2.p1  ORF type:complete len:228 (+),score=14.75 TRINITY_DN1225_c2_g1_i2:170-853(+)